MNTNPLRPSLLTALAAILFLFLSLPPLAHAQPYGQPDRAEPGDPMIQAYLAHAAEQIEATFLANIKSADDWAQARPRLRQQYFDMLGLWPLPEKTPLQANVTRMIDRGDYFVEMLHFQSRPGLYVTGNLYRPARRPADSRLPAVLYVCGHSPRPRNGNKTAYQSHGIWFARHGYTCLILDTLEMGELTCTHHGTYSEGRWWWLSRGYTPAAVECWNGIRALDYLASLPYVDPARLAVTGISGGGAATTWISAADDRVAVSIPVSGWSDLLAHVPNRVVNGHCDCMFHYNTYQWPFAQVLGLIAPRPLLFVNSDADPIFPMDGNERLINRLERLYSLHGAGDLLDAVVSVGGHAYRQDIRQAAFRFLNTHLKADPRPVTDSEIDLVTAASGPNQPETHPIPPEKLRVFPQDTDFPKDAINSRIDHEFVPLAQPQLPAAAADLAQWKAAKLARLRELSFHHFPATIPAATALPAAATTSTSNTNTTANENPLGFLHLATEPGITVRLKPARLTPPAPATATAQAPAQSQSPGRIWLLITGDSDADPTPLHQQQPPAWLTSCATDRDAIYLLEPRGLGASRWTKKNPPNYVERAHYLLGRTVDSGRVWDIIATANYLRALHPGQNQVHLAGHGSAAVLAAYATLLEPNIAGLALSQPPASHMDPAAPQLLGVLRVLDIPDAIAFAAPKPLTLIAPPEKSAARATDLYRLAGAADKLTLQQ